MKHKALILELLHVLVDKTKSERGYSSAGRLLTRLLHTLSGVYPLNSRFVNTDEWDSEGKFEFFLGSVLLVMLTLRCIQISRKTTIFTGAACMEQEMLLLSGMVCTPILVPWLDYIYEMP